MSEKTFAFFLRLYPAHFREKYAAEALQLFRDRARDEQGFYPALQLWFDLITDLVVSLPREYFRPRPALLIAPAREHLFGVPSLFVLGDAPPAFHALLSGAVLSFAALTLCSISLFEGIHTATARGPIFQNGHSQAGSFDRRFAATDPERTAVEQPAPRANVLDTAERQRIVAAAARIVRQSYVYPDTGKKMADSLLAHMQNGDDNAVLDGAVFAALLTAQMREVSHDMHVDMVYEPGTLPSRTREQSTEDLVRYRDQMQRQNCTVEEAAISRNRVAYLKLNSFPEAAICGDKIVDTLASLNGADALIIDLRDNRGGFPEMVSLVASYLFDHPEYFYNPRENTSARSWTQSPIPGNKLAFKPVYLLTSSSTISAAEQFSYNLKMLKRVTIIGETTAGGAHSGVFHRIDDHFGLGVPEARAINPYGTLDWEGVGVEPDVKVKAADALTAAENLLTARRKK